jgi:N-acetylmuramoyl-L-alanine amidase
VNLFAYASWFFGRIGDAILPKPMNTPLIAICVGHSRFIGAKRDGGAVSAGGVSEWTYNRDLAFAIERILRARGIISFVCDKYEGTGYTDSMRWVASHIKGKQATLALELHFNAATGTAKGHEWLYWGTSKDSKRLADCLREAYVKAVPGALSRGSKAKASGDRGGEFLKLTHCPAVIAEPFFGDNPKEWDFASKNQTAIAEAICDGIEEYLKA